MHSDGINILILRAVRPEHLDDFEAAVRAWIPTAVEFPGHQGVFMLTPPPGSHEYGALLRFRDEQSWHEFSAWETYRAFLKSIHPMLSAEPKTESMHGMEAWFRPRSSPPPPRWKMAVVTYIGVVCMVWIASRLVGIAWSDAPGWAAYLLINAIVVTGLTWAVMPGLSRLMGGWLRVRRAIP
jgi:antibiotic biosynthesis monooxygenase (ABM) superfamily enzyme